MDNFGIWQWTKFICCNRPFDERFDFANKPTDQLYSCLSNENSISNLSTGEHFASGISSISNNLTNGHYSIDRNTLNRNHTTGSNHSSPNQPNPIYEYNLAELALLDNQRAQQYIQQQQQQTRHHRQSNNKSAKPNERNSLVTSHTDGAEGSSQQPQFSENQLTNSNHQLELEDEPPALPPYPSKHLLKRNNYYTNIYSAPPQYSEPDFTDSLAALSNHPTLNYSNPPQYTPTSSTVPIYDQATTSSAVANLESEFNGYTNTSNLIHNNLSSNSSTVKSLSNHHHHLPHHTNQNSLLSSMDGLRVQLARTKKQMAAVANSASQLNSSHLSQNGQSNATAAAQNLVANLVPNQIRAPQIQRSAEMQISLKGWLYRLEGPALKQWKRRWFVLGEYCLFYYKDAQEQKMIGSVLLPSYTVSPCTANGDGITRKFSFKLEHHNLKTHYLAAECAESMHQWMTLISLSATMQLNAANYEQLTDGTISSALTAASISRNRPDSQDMMNMILGARSMSATNNENNKNFANTQEPLDQLDQFNSTASSSVNNGASLYNGHQRRDSTNLDNSNHDNLTKLSDLNESGSESGFANYKSRRQSKTNSELDTSVSNAYNSVGLPTTASAGNYSIYSSNSQTAHKSANQLNQQPIYAPKRSHYVNAPPKPRRHQPQASNVNGNLNTDFDTYSNGAALNLYGTSAKPPIHPNLPMHPATQQPDLIDANGGYPPHDLYSIPPTSVVVNHQQRQQRNGSFSTQADDKQQAKIDENLYMQHHRRTTLTRQNASDSGRVTPMDDAVLGVSSNNAHSSYYETNGNVLTGSQMKSRPKSSQEHQPQFAENMNVQQFYANNLHNNQQDNQIVDQLSSPPYRPWSDFLQQQAQRSQSTTPMSNKQNRLPGFSAAATSTAASTTNAMNTNSTSALAVSAALVALGTQPTSHAQLNAFAKANRYDADEHAKQFYSNAGHLNPTLRTDSPDYMNIEYFKQQQSNQSTAIQQPPLKDSTSSNQLMQKLDINLEQQEKIYQSVLSKNARLEIENLKNEVAKQKQLKEKQQQQQNQSLSESITQENDDSKLSNLSADMDQDIIPPPLKLDARSIKRRDSERSARLAQLELEKAAKMNEEKYEEDDVTTTDEDEVNLSPNPFCRSQFRRSFMNAVYTQKPSTNIAASYASHAYCGPIDDEPPCDNLDDGSNLKNLVNKQNFDQNSQKSLETHETSPKLTMQQRRDQLQRLLHSDSSLESDVNNKNFDDQQNQQITAIKPPRNTFKLTKDCFSEAVRATPAIIVATPEKANESIVEEAVRPNEEQVNQVKKQLAFDLIEPIVAHKPPRGNSKEIVKQLPADEVNVKDRIKHLEQQNSSESSLPNSTSNSSLNARETNRIEPINLTNRLRSNSLCEEQSTLDTEMTGQRKRSFSGQNLNCLNIRNEESLACEDKKPAEKEDEIIEKQSSNQNEQDEEDNGYLTMESKLSSNNEIDEEQSISLSPSSVEQQTDQKSVEGPSTNLNLPENVNFDEVFGADVTKQTSDEDADDEQSLKSQVNQPEPDETNALKEPREPQNVDCLPSEEDDNRNTMDDQFAIYSGLSTIKKAPANFKSSLKLTSALISQQSNYSKQNQLSQQFLQVTQSQQELDQNQIAEQLNNLQLSSMLQEPSTSQQSDQPQCMYKPQQQIVASSIINRGNNLVFVSNPVISPEMMDANPAYESFDGIFYGQQCLPAIEEEKKQIAESEATSEKPNEEDCISNSSKENCKVETVLLSSTSSSSQQPTNAPYYYADLLTEEQQLELKAKSNEDRPPLSSRSGNVVGSITSLQKLSPKKTTQSTDVKEEVMIPEANESDLENDDKIPETQTPFTTPPKVSSSISSVPDTQLPQSNVQQPAISSSITQPCEPENGFEIEDDEHPIYENVTRLTNSTRSQSSINQANNTQSYPVDHQPNDDYSGDADLLRRVSHNYINQNVHKMKPSNQEVSEEEPHTPTKLNNAAAIKNTLHHKTTPIHMRSPTVAGYATIDSEQAVLINEDYKVQQSPDIAMNTNSVQNNVNKLSWKPNLISQSASNLSKIKPNNLYNHDLESDSQTSLSSVSSAHSLNQVPRNEIVNDLNPFSAANYYRQQSAPNLLHLNNNLPNNLNNNYHGNNLNNNAEKCLANKQLNLNKNINKINNLLNASNNAQDYAVYENADAERAHLLALQKQLQQQQELLYQQQKQLQMLQQRQKMSYVENAAKARNNGNRKKTTKLRKNEEDDLSSDLRMVLPATTEDENNRHYAGGEDMKPSIPPLPTNYKQVNYEKTYGEKTYEKTKNAVGRSFMNAVYTQKPSTNIAASYASHAYCGPIDDEPPCDNLDDGSNLKNLVNKQNFDQNSQKSLETHETSPKLTMQQRRDQLQRLLHSDSSLESDVNNKNFDDQQNQQITAIKPPRNTFKLTKDCFSEAVRATPAIIVATPEKANESIVEEAVRPNEEQVNQVKKQLAFDLIEPIVAHKPPRGNSKEIVKQLPADEVNVKDRIKHLEQQNSSESSLPNSTSNSSLNARETNRIEPINLTNRLRSNSLCEEQSTLDTEMTGQRKRSFSGQNLNCLNIRNEESLACEDKKPAEKEDEIIEKQSSNQNEQDEEDNGYLTMESKLSSNNEIDEEQSISLSPSSVEQQTDQKSVEGPSTNLNLPENVNFDEVFGADVTKQTSDEDADDEQSLKSQVNQPEPDETNALKEPREPQNVDCLPSEEDDNRNTMDDQFAIYSGLSTIKKAPANFKSSLKLTSALISQQSNYSKQNQLSQQFLQVTQSQQELDQNQIAEQLNNLQLSSMLQEPSTSQQSDQPQCMYKPQQQIVASSIINRGNNLVFVSNPVISPEMMDANPAYESFDGIFYGQQCLPAIEEEKKQIAESEATSEKPNEEDCISNSSKENCKVETVLLSSTSSSSQQPTNAPYYYADLLTEEQQLELKAKSNEDRPPLSSRSGNVVGSITSLQKLSPKKTTQSTDVKEEVMIPEANESDLENDDKIPETQTPFTTPPKVSSSISSVPDTQLPQSNVQQPAISSSITQPCEPENGFEIEDDEHPIYENVTRLTNSTRSQSSINQANNTQSYPVDHQPNDDYSGDADLLRRVSHNYINQNVHKMKPSNQEVSEEEPHTPTKLNNAAAIKNTLHHKTTPIHMRSPTVAGYATIDSEQAVLINEDYKVQQSPDIAMNTNSVQNNVNKLSWKPNLISQSASNLSKIKPNNLYNHDLESDSQTSLSSVSSAHSLNQVPRNEIVNDLNPFSAANYYRQQSAPNLLHLNNNLPNNLNNNYHGNNLNNNAEKCLANKQLNLNKNINKINNLLNASNNAQDYAVYENADAERAHLLALQKQLQQQQELLYQQQKQLQMLQQRQKMSYVENAAKARNNGNRKKTTKLRKNEEDDLSSDLRMVLPATTEDENNRHYAGGEDMKPSIPPLPTNYKQVNYEKTYGEKTYEKTKNAVGLVPKHTSHQLYATANETNLEQQNRLLYQRQLSKSVGDNLQQCKPQDNKFSTLDSKNRLLRPCLSAGDLLGKTHEELILLLIQLKRNQSQLKHTIEKLSLQMESEDKLSIYESHRVAEHKLKYEQVKEQLIEAQKQYESRFPLIDMIDNMVRLNSNSRSNLNSIYGYSQTNVNSLSTNNVYLSSTQQDKKEKRNTIYSSTVVDTAKATSTGYLNHLDQEQPSNNHQKRTNLLNDESDYACESDTNNMESTYTNRSSMNNLHQQSEKQDLLMNQRNQAAQDQSISTTTTATRNLEIPSSSASHKKSSNHSNNSNSQKNSHQSNSKASEQTLSQATTNTLSSVISSVKQMNKTSTNLQVNQQHHQQASINQPASRKTNATVLAEEEMNRMKEQQMLLEAELERVRSMLINSQQLNVPSVQQSNNGLDDLSIVTTTENHFQAELANIDEAINNLNAKKEKLIQSLKGKEEKYRSRDLMNHHQMNIEDGTDLFTDDDAIFSTANSIDFERVLDDGNLSLCTDVDDLELSKHENEYMNTLKAEYEQNLKQQKLDQERKKSEQQVREGEQGEQSITNINEDDETTTETTILKTLRLVKRKYENSKLNNKQLTFDPSDVLNIVEVKKSDAQLGKMEKKEKYSSLDGQQLNKLKMKCNDARRMINGENESQSVLAKNTKQQNKHNNNLLTEPSLDDDHLLPSEISQLLLDSALIIYEKLKPPKRRSTGSSVSSERSIDDQSDEDGLDVIGQQAATVVPSSNIIKKQPKVSNVLPSISASIPTLLDLNRDLSRDLNRNLEREINNMHHHSSKMSHHHRSPASLRELMFDADFGLNGLSKLKKDSKMDAKPKMIPMNGRGGKMNKKKMDKNGYASNIELEEEMTRIF